jgi:uncharacterized membrane protein YdjX (TVP38/TMEM64 family)
MAAALGTQSPAPHHPRWRKIVATTLVLSLIGCALVVYFTTGIGKEWTTSFLDWVRQHGIAGALAFTGMYAVCTVAFLPGSVLTLGAGFVFAQVSLGCAWGAHLCVLMC